MPAENISMLSMEDRIAILKELGYDSDGELVLKDGKPVIDPYIDQAVTVKNMAILPGSTIVLDCNFISISRYIDAHGTTAFD